MSFDISPAILDYIEFLEETGRTERRYLTADEVDSIFHWVGDDTLREHLQFGHHTPANGLCFEICLTPSEACAVDEACELLGIGV